MDRPKVYGAIEVTGSVIPPWAVTVEENETSPPSTPVGDGSEVLRDFTGVQLGRMGGHGLEIYLRGQSQGDVTVVLDGATINGGCPNRMDPPASFAAAETTDTVTLIRGVQTLRYGPGAPGGTVLFDRRPSRFEDTSWSVDLGVAGTNWSDGPDATVDAAVGLGDWSLRALASHRKAGNYEDGSGDEVRSAAESRSAALMVGWRSDERTSLDLSYERTATDDALFAGAGMDAPMDRSGIFRVATEREATADDFGWAANAFFNTVEHFMDNYSLRPLTAPMALEVPTDTSTWGFRGHLELGRRSPVLIGLTGEVATADATRFAGPDPDSIAMVQSIMWPDVERTQIGVFAEAATPIGSAARVVYGVRVDHFGADAGRADERTMGGNGPSPSMLWSMYSDAGDPSWSATGVGGLIRFERRAGPWSLFAGLSRSVRPADATERFIAANNAVAAKRWVGNPELDPARHHQLDVGIDRRSRDGSFTMILFAADVGDHILRDRAHLQEGVLRGDNATVYRNVDARRYGAEVEGVIRIGPAWILSGGLAWVRADNTTDDRPLAQTPPLTGSLAAHWSDGPWSVSGTLRCAAKQDRVDDDPATGSGLDLGPTPGWATLDLAADIDVGAGFALALGVANAFDRTYANHLNRSNLFDPDPVRVNEPGRTYWLRLGWRGRG